MTERCLFCLDEYDPDDVPEDWESEFDDSQFGKAPLCPECIQKRVDGFVTLIGIDLDKSPNHKHADRVYHNEVERTGETGYLLKDAWEQMCSPKVPADGVCFVPSEVIKRLNMMFLPQPELEGDSVVIH